MSISPWQWQSAKCLWYCTHITSAISSHLLFSLPLSALHGTPSTRLPEHQPGSISTASWKSLRSKVSTGRCAWRAMSISGGYSRILKCHFKMPNIHLMMLCADACWRLNSSFLLVGLEWSLAEKWSLMSQRHTKVGHSPTLQGGSVHPGKEWWVNCRWEILHLPDSTTHARWEDQWYMHPQT